MNKIDKLATFDTQNPLPRYLPTSYSYSLRGPHIYLLGYHKYLCFTMFYIDMESVQIYQPQNKVPNVRDSSSIWKGKNPVGLEAGLKAGTALHKHKLIQSQNGTASMREDSRAVTSWDDMIPFSVQRGSDRPNPLVIHKEQHARLVSSTVPQQRNLPASRPKPHLEAGTDPW